MNNFHSNPTFINDLCLQPELILSLKQNSSSWFSSIENNLRKFQLLFYRFIEIDLFQYKHPKEKYFIDIFNEISSKKNVLLLRILIEYHFLFQQLKSINSKRKSVDEELIFENSDGQFWPQMREDFLQSTLS